MKVSEYVSEWEELIKTNKNKCENVDGEDLTTGIMKWVKLGQLYTAN